MTSVLSLPLLLIVCKGLLRCTFWQVSHACMMTMKKRSKKEASKASLVADKSALKKGRIVTRPAGDLSNSRWFLTIGKTFIVLFVVYVSVPFILRLFPGLLGHVLYLNIFRVPFFVDLSRPSELSLNHTVNFYLTPEEGITLGVWHTVPDCQWREAQGKDLVWYQESLKDGAPVIIYLHGNAGTRGVSHRVELMKVLTAAGFHVLAVDYRGFAESTGLPSETGLTADAQYLYNWVKARSGRSLVCLWGHSLGTGVATNAALKVQEQGTNVDAVILEAPYTNIREEGANHPFSKMYWKFPGFEYFFLDTIALNNVVFPNDENLKTMDSPLLILHAEDDHIVPFHMSQKLFVIAHQAQGSKNRVQIVPFSGSLGYFHNGIYKDPNLPRIIWEFLQPLKA
ncbi:hypothetical protein SKAU_G00168220 [Synaphobranchus kaupii]|uniref:AB hydrolase-1 domain-containing protein n=1 Tax=Synaphobranchus kaupii TaxID=118154 RepID=A0A9Q1FKD7_SYNKA|nr:hypothetical protein SKAU_G00168220 [Synaphobranchus kaupii]